MNTEATRLTTRNIYVKGQQHCYSKQGDEMMEKG